MSQCLCRGDSLHRVPLQHLRDQVHEFERHTKRRDLPDSRGYIPGDLRLQFIDQCRVPSLRGQQSPADHQSPMPFYPGLQGHPERYSRHDFQQDYADRPHVEGPGLRGVCEFLYVVARQVRSLQTLGGHVLRGGSAETAVAQEVVGRAEVDQFDACVVLLADQDVVGLQVAVDYVERGQHVDYLQELPGEQLKRQNPGELCEERRVLDQVHALATHELTLHVEQGLAQTRTTHLVDRPEVELVRFGTQQTRDTGKGGVRDLVEKRY